MKKEVPQKQKNQITVAVLMGGIGQERQISIQSGSCVAKALKQAGFNVITSDITPENLEILNKPKIDVFFIALHGKFGEDGQLQKLLEDKQLNFTGSGSKASQLAFDKIASKKLFVKVGLKTPDAIEFNCQADDKKLNELLLPLGDNFVIKPSEQGSSVGISIVKSPQQAIDAARQTYEQYGPTLIERFIRGREITVGVLSGQTLPIIEIRSKTNFYNYQAKYIDDQTEFLLDTIKDSSLRQRINQAALDCFDTLGCKDFARVDFILSDDNRPYVLEVNTIPGFTDHSLLPKAAAKAGLPMSALCTKIVEAALQNKSVRP